MAATTKVRPNMSMQIPPTISPVRMFFFAKRLVIISEKNTFYGRPGLDRYVALQAPIS